MNENEKNLVSVVIPVYNVERYLGPCVESVCGQTYQNLEIILVDDGSPDRCGEICDFYAARDSRIRVIHKKNGGLSDARNAGLREANGDYVMFVDSDDLVAINYVSEMLLLAVRYQADIVACDFLKFRQEDDTVSDRRKVRQGGLTILNRDEAVLAWMYRRYYGVSAWAKIYSACCIRGIRFPVGKLHEDVGTTYKMFLQAHKTVYTKEKLYYYRQREGSITNVDFNVRRLDYLDFTREIMQLMKEQYPKYYQASVSRHFQGCIQIGCAQKKLDRELALEIRKYAGNAMRDGNCRMIYRVLAVCAVASPGLAVRLAGMGSE